MKLFQGFISLGVLVALATGCTPMKSKINSVKVEEASQSDAGVVLDTVPTSAYTVPIDDTVYTASNPAVVVAAPKSDLAVAVAVEAQNAVALKNRSAASVAMVAAPESIGKPIAIPVAPITSYRYASNKEILNALKVHLGSNYLQLLDLYNSTVSNGKSMDLVPQMNVLYTFKADLSEGKFSDFIQFPLRDAFGGYGAIFYLKGDQVKHYWGVGILGKNLSNVRLASNSDAVPQEIANIFDLSANSELFKSTDANFFGFQAVSGGNIFGINFSGSQFTLNSLATTLPVVANTNTIASKRVNSDLVAQLGSAVKLNGRIFYYADANGVVTHTYYMGSDFIFKELKSQCNTLAKVSLLPATMTCAANNVAQPVVAEEATALSADLVATKALSK